VGERERVTLAGGVEQAEGERAHERALLLAPAAIADALDERSDLGGDAETAGTSLHQLAHARVADAHPDGRLGAGEALQVAEHGGLTLSRTEAPLQSLEELAQAHAVVEVAGEIALEGCPVGQLARLRAGPPQTAARAVLFDASAEAGQHEPPGGVGDLLPFEHDHVQALPGL